MGEPSKVEELQLEVGGMTCDSCAAHVEKALSSVEHVSQVNVPNWKSGRATVIADGEIAADALTAAVRRAGYSARVRSRKPLGQITGDEPRGSGGGDFDLMVIGHGSAGFAAAIQGAELDRSVALVGEGEIGGTCVNWGCVPSKNLIWAMEQHHRAAASRFAGVRTAADPVSWPQVIDQKEALVHDLRQAKYLDVLDAYPAITHIQGRARLAENGGVAINGQVYTPRKIVLATGARPWAPPIPGLDQVQYLDSTSALELRELPRSMIVLGGNAVGLELAQTFARAGVYVTVLELLPRIAPFEDEELSVALDGYLQREGIRIVTEFETRRVEKRDDHYWLTGVRDGTELSFEAQELLVATGRRPNTEGLGLQDVSVEVGERGEILVNDRLQTSNPDIYAAGDVLARDMFVYVAAYGGKLAAANALTGSGDVYDASYIARITFTDPQVASAGLTEQQARAQGNDVKVSSLAMEHVPRALAARDTRGLIKLVADAETDRLLGAHVLAPEAGEVIQTAALALRFGLTVRELRDTMFPYLTNVEGLKLALLSFEKDVTRLSCCAG